MEDSEDISYEDAIHEGVEKIVEKKMGKMNLSEAREYLDFLERRFEKVDESYSDNLAGKGPEELEEKVKAEAFAIVHYEIAKKKYEEREEKLKKLLCAYQTDPAVSDSIRRDL